MTPITKRQAFTDNWAAQIIAASHIAGATIRHGLHRTWLCWPDPVHPDELAGVAVQEYARPGVVRLSTEIEPWPLSATGRTVYGVNGSRPLHVYGRFEWTFSATELPALPILDRLEAWTRHQATGNRAAALAVAFPELRPYHFAPIATFPDVYSWTTRAEARLCIIRGLDRRRPLDRWRPCCRVTSTRALEVLNPGPALLDDSVLGDLKALAPAIRSEWADLLAAGELAPNTPMGRTLARWPELVAKALQIQPFYA